MIVLPRRRSVMGRRPFPLLVLLTMVASAFVWSVTYAYVTDTANYYPPNYLTFQPPGVGGSYLDPVFGTAVKRMSNAMTQVGSDGSGLIQWISPEYSTMSPFNIDNTRVLAVFRSYFGLYDGAGNYLRDLPLEVHASSEPRWSRQNPNVFYYLHGNQLKQFNVGTWAATIVHTFSEYSFVTGRFESDISFDGNHLVFAGDGRYIFVYTIPTDTKGPVLDANGLAFDSLYLTADGHVTVSWDNRGLGRYQGIEMFDQNMNFIRQVTHAGGHMDVTRDSNGDEILVWANAADPQPPISCDAGIVKVRLADATQTCLIRFDWTMAEHISAPDNNGWVFIETYTPGDPVPPVGWNRYANEILQVKLDGSEVRRLVHHRSRPFNTYNYTPKTSVSHDGTKLIFGSNYGLQAQLGYPTEYTDVYMVDVPVSASGSTIFGTSAPTTFWTASTPVELGVKFRSDVNGTITAIRFYKGVGDTGPHTGSLWSSTGTLLATSTFSGETGSGWQVLNLATRVAITANTTYVASYHSTGSFYYSNSFFQNAGVDNPPLHALRNGVDGGNGVYSVSDGGVFPSFTWASSNYWVDVVFVPDGSSGGGPQSIIPVSGTPQSTLISTSFANALQAKVTDVSANPIPNITVTFNTPTSGASARFNGNTSVTATTNAAGIATSPIPIANNISGTYSVLASIAGLSPAAFTLTNTVASTGTTIFGSSAPITFWTALTPVELGVKFRSDANGTITAIRFYKGVGDTGPHTGSLWSSTGALLTTGTFSGETGSGWQVLNLATPVAVTANTTYVASYHSTGSFFYSNYFFQNAGVDNPPLHALRDGVDGGNGVYIVSDGGVFPSFTWASSNYWVDVVFSIGN